MEAHFLFHAKYLAESTDTPPPIPTTESTFGMSLMSFCKVVPLETRHHVDGDRFPAYPVLDQIPGDLLCHNRISPER